MKRKEGEGSRVAVLLVVAFPEEVRERAQISRLEKKFPFIVPRPPRRSSSYLCRFFQRDRSCEGPAIPVARETSVAGTTQPPDTELNVSDNAPETLSQSFLANFDNRPIASRGRGNFRE